MGSLYLGSAKVGSLYLGTAKVKELYKGSTKVWSNDNDFVLLTYGQNFDFENKKDVPIYGDCSDVTSATISNTKVDTPIGNLSCISVKNGTLNYPISAISFPFTIDFFFKPYHCEQVMCRLLTNFRTLFYNDVFNGNPVGLAVCDDSKQSAKDGSFTGSVQYLNGGKTFNNGNVTGFQSNGMSLRNFHHVALEVDENTMCFWLDGKAIALFFPSVHFIIDSTKYINIQNLAWMESENTIVTQFAIRNKLVWNVGEDFNVPNSPYYTKIFNS